MPFVLVCVFLFGGQDKSKNDGLREPRKPLQPMCFLERGRPVPPQRAGAGSRKGY